MSENPITIVGGGLAGLSLAVGLAKRGVGVVLHEAQHYPRHRVCGEFILGLTAEQEAQLGIESSLADAVLHRESAWFRGNRDLGRFTLPYPAKSISRHRLDQRLAALAEQSGAAVRTGSRFPLPETPPAGLVRALGRRRVREGRWIGLKAHFRGFAMEAGLEMHLGAGGYAGLAGIEDGAVNLCALLPAPLQPAPSREQQMLTQLRHVGLSALAERLAAAELVVESCVGVSHFELGWVPPSAGAGVQVGDHLGIIPPFTGAGMSMSFESSALALEPLAGYARGEQSWALTQQAIATAQTSAFRKRMTWATRLHPWLTSRWLQPLLAGAAAARLLPFRWMTHYLRSP
jgi:menaquinone-9 beta-reductase